MPTLKQKLAFKEITEKHRPVSTVMKEVGYKESTSNKPSNLTESDGWNELMNKHLPDSALAKKHRELLNKREYRTFYGNSEDIGPETQAVSKALDMAYRLKGRYEEGEDRGNKTLIVMITGETAQRYAIPSITSTSSIEPKTI